MSKIADTEANATSLDGLVNDNGLIATLRNGPKPSYQYLVDGWNTEFNALIDNFESQGDSAIASINADVVTVEAAKNSAVSNINLDVNTVDSAKNSALDYIDDATAEVTAKVDSFNAIADVAISDFEDESEASIAAFEANSQAAIIEMQKSRGFRRVGTFEDGFTYELANDVGIDSNGEAWVLTDISSLPFVVPATTTPTDGVYTKVTYNSAENVQMASGESVQKFTTQSRQAIEAVYKAQGYNSVFFFEDGFTYTESNDVGIYEDGTAWTYADSDALPVTIAAGAVPGEGVYKSVKVVLPSFDTVADMESATYLATLAEDTGIVWDGYYVKGDGGGNSGLLKFGTHTVDGGSIFSIDSNTYIKAIHEDEINLLKYGATESDVNLNTSAWLSATSDGNRDLLVPFGSIAGYTLNQTIEIKPNSKLRFEKGARVNGASSLSGLPVIKTKEGSGNDLLPPAIATTNIEIENPYITINGAGSIGIETGAGGHDIKITEPVIRSGDGASDQIGILESNSFNTDVSNPSIVLTGTNAVCRAVRNYKYESDGITPATGYSVLTNTGSYRGTYKHTGDGSTALQLWSLNKKGDLTTGGASADGIYIGNSAFLTLKTALDTTSVDVRGPFTGLVIDVPHIENPRTFMRTGSSDVKAEVRSAKPQSAGDVFDIGSAGTTIECPNFSGFLTSGAPLMNLVSSSSVGQLVIHPASLSSTIFAELQNSSLRFSTIRGKTFQRNFTNQTSYDVKFPFDDNVVITHANSGVNFAVNLPPNAPIGVVVTVSKTAAGSLTLNPDASDRVLFGGVTNTIGAPITTSDVGSTITICKTSQGWVVLGSTGGWS